MTCGVDPACKSLIWLKETFGSGVAREAAVSGLQAMAHYKDELYYFSLLLVKVCQALPYSIPSLDITLDIVSVIFTTQKGPR